MNHQRLLTRAQNTPRRERGRLQGRTPQHPSNLGVWRVCFGLDYPVSVCSHLINAGFLRTQGNPSAPIFSPSFQHHVSFGRDRSSPEKPPTNQPHTGRGSLAPHRWNTREAPGRLWNVRLACFGMRGPLRGTRSQRTMKEDQEKVRQKGQSRGSRPF